MISRLFILFGFIIVSLYGEEQQNKVLHLTFHKGCSSEIEKVAKQLSLDLTTWFIPELPPYSFDETSLGNALYNIGHVRAERIWKKHKTTFEKFDVILVSDTAPLARIFLQNGWPKPLIIWICNRFDYCDNTSLDCEFPDAEFYDLFNQAKHLPNVKFIGYTAFEHYYTKTKGVDTGNLVITPFGSADVSKNIVISLIPQEIVKKETFFLPPYHNETIFMNLAEKCRSMNINTYCGRYNGPLDLEDFKGIIHLPYAWSNLALFENMQTGVPYFLPSKAFLRELLTSGNYFYQNTPFLLDDGLYELSEWYSLENSPIFTYFDSWEDLAMKIEKADYPKLRENSKAFALEKEKIMMDRWKMIFSF